MLYTRDDNSVLHDTQRCRWVMEAGGAEKRAGSCQSQRLRGTVGVGRFDLSAFCSFVSMLSN